MLTCKNVRQNLIPLATAYGPPPLPTASAAKSALAALSSWSSYALHSYYK